ASACAALRPIASPATWQVAHVRPFVPRFAKNAPCSTNLPAGVKVAAAPVESRNGNRLGMVTAATAVAAPTKATIPTDTWHFLKKLFTVTPTFLNIPGLLGSKSNSKELVSYYSSSSTLSAIFKTCQSESLRSTPVQSGTTLTAFLSKYNGWQVISCESEGDSPTC